MKHVLIGTNTSDYNAIREAAVSGTGLDAWVVPKSATVGDRVALFVHYPGFVAFGEVASSPIQSTFGEQVAYRSNIRDVSLLPAPVPLDHVRSTLPHWGWLNQRVKGRTTPPDGIASELEQIILAFQADFDGEQHTAFSEGALRHQQSIRQERNPAARLACIDHHGSDCVICGFSFEATYGPTVAGVIQVHHLQPLASRRSSHKVSPIRDLIPICANCHLVIHRRSPPYTPAEVQEMLGFTSAHDG